MFSACSNNCFVEKIQGYYYIYLLSLFIICTNTNTNFNPIGLQYMMECSLVSSSYLKWSNYLEMTILNDNVVVNIISDTISQTNDLFRYHLRDVFTLSIAMQFSTPIKGNHQIIIIIIVIVIIVIIIVISILVHNKTGLG